jgi:tetratricopeptide (TPR) repeat protein
VTTRSLRGTTFGPAKRICASAILGACFALLIATARSAQEHNPLHASRSRDLAQLQLTAELRAELSDTLNRREYKRAEAILVEEAERDPKSVRAAQLLVYAAGIFFLDGQYLNAAISWKRAEAIAPLDEASRFTLAMAYIKLDRRDWARQELEKLLVGQPQNPLYLYWLARLDYDSQNYSAAIKRLKKVIEFDPKMMRAYDTLGLCYDYLGQFDEAIRYYQSAVALNRSERQPSPWPHLNLAMSLISVSQLPEAEKSLREALRYDPKLPQAHYQLGRVLEMQGEYQGAVPELKEAIQNDAAFPEPHYLLGRIYQRVGEQQLAQTEIRLYQELKKAREGPAKGSAQGPN